MLRRFLDEHPHLAEAAVWLLAGAIVLVVLSSSGMAVDGRVFIVLASIGASFTLRSLTFSREGRTRQQRATTRESLGSAFLRWGSRWTLRDLALVLSSCVVMVVGMALLQNQGSWLLAPVLAGIVILLPTPLSKHPFEGNQD